MFTVVKNTLTCNKDCWFCSDCGTTSMNSEDVIGIYKQEDPDNMLIIGGEPMLMGIPYYLNILDAGVSFAMQTNFTLYTEEWNQVFKHPNFKGLSISGDKMPEDEFLRKLKLYRGTNTDIPLVLIVLQDEATLYYWYYLSVKHGFPIKFNYLMPLGKIKGMELDVKPYYRMMTDFIDVWDPKYTVEPLSGLLDNSNVCPHINCVTKTPDIYSFEPDGTKYFCCALGSLGMTRDQLPNGRVVPMSCLECEDFSQCRGCVVRNDMVIHDKEYCETMKTFFNKIRSKRDAR